MICMHMFVCESGTFKSVALETSQAKAICHINNHMHQNAHETKSARMQRACDVPGAGTGTAGACASSGGDSGQLHCSWRVRLDHKRRCQWGFGPCLLP